MYAYLTTRVSNDWKIGLKAMQTNRIMDALNDDIESMVYASLGN